MIRLPDLSAGLLGERCTGAVAILKTNHNFSSSGDKESPEGLPIEVLLQGESRLVVVHENEERTTTTSLTARLIGARKKSRLDANESAKAIIAYPRPEQPNSVAFNLSVAAPAGGGSGLFRQRPSKPSSRSLFGSFDEPASSFDAGGFNSQQSAGQTASQPTLSFIRDIDQAADVPADDPLAESRDIRKEIEDELMDLEEIEGEILQMETNRKRVFFEEG